MAYNTKILAKIQGKKHEYLRTKKKYFSRVFAKK